ncbi:HpcH/HpaI aldolase/citrate lyase family protein [Aeromicrobium sp. CTD01-1L150]|uniref:HpcH/HpaI aldolase/citrate lyase family protein n=1 Tax=Aeromicrobium sp. CTD01-1L150 TaxID=3341830 RepID=UPI0035C1447A
MSPRPHRLRRSELSTPGSSPKMIARAATSAADLVFLDLEDAVAPSEKVETRANIVAGLNQENWGTKTRACRINSVSTQWCHGDVVEVVEGAGHALDVIIVPKIKAPRDVWFVDDLLTQLEQKNGLEVGRIGIEVLIEETEALARVEEIAGCSQRLEALILGVGDLSASQGVRTGHIGGSDDSSGVVPYPGDLWHYARNRMIVAARAHGIDAIDGPYGAFNDPDGYRTEASWSASLGSVGKWCIHPSQISIANEVYAPTPEEVKHAKAVVEAVRSAEASGDGAANLDGMMIDAATARIFEATVDRAARCGVL